MALVVAAAVTWAGRPGWPTLLWWVALASLALVVALWSSLIGVATGGLGMTDPAQQPEPSSPAA